MKRHTNIKYYSDPAQFLHCLQSADRKFTAYCNHYWFILQDASFMLNPFVNKLLTYDFMAFLFRVMYLVKVFSP